MREIVHLKLDIHGSNPLFQDGTIEIWEMVEHVITEWRCVVRTNQFPAEVFIKAHFIPRRRKVSEETHQTSYNHPNAMFTLATFVQ